MCGFLYYNYIIIWKKIKKFVFLAKNNAFK